MIGKLRTLKSVLSAYWWLFMSSGTRFRLQNRHSVLFTSDNTYYAPYLPGLVNAFDQDEWCIWVFNPHMVLTLHLKSGFQCGRFSSCLFKHQSSRRIHLGLRQSRSTTSSISPDFYNAVERRMHGKLEINECLLPFVMHASQYQFMRRMKGVESQNIRIFFSGNSDPGSYDNPIINDTFNILNRHNIKQLVTSEFEHLLNTRKSGDDTQPLWWIDWQWRPGQQGGYDNRIENNEWFSFLNRSTFFLACPGVRMPICHNLIEAMYCGCIPILQHPQLFAPALEHGVNCLVFNSKESLKEQMNVALAMDEEKLRKMQKEVKHYYKANLSPDCIKSVLKNPQYNRYYFQVNQVSTHLWTEQNKNSLQVF